MAPAPFHSDRSWRFDASPEHLWERINAADEFTTWWPWLRTFEADHGIVEGATWHCVVDPPLPYTVTFGVRFDAVEPARLVESTVTGDIGGTARLTIARSAQGTEARLVSELRPTNLLLRSVGVVARPLVEYGHNWILDEGRRQFAERAFRDAGPGPNDESDR